MVKDGNNNPSEVEMVKLQASDDKIFKLSLNGASMSKTLKTMIDDLGSDDLHEIIPVQVSSKVMAKVVEYCEHHAEHSELSKEDRDAWNKAFLEPIPQSDLAEIILGANYLDMEELLRAGVRVVLDRIKGKSADEMREFLNIEGDLTTEELDQIRKENEWIHPK